MPTEDSTRLRPAYAALGVAGVLVATVFAAVAAVAAKPEKTAAAAPDDRQDSTVSVTTTKGSPVVVVPPPASNDAVVTSTKPTTTTTKPTTTTTTLQVPTPQPLPPGPAPKQKPIPRFIADNCPAQKCSFDGSGSFDPDGSIIYYAWAFGDRQGVDGSRQVAPSHQYQQPRTYEVTLLVTDNEGQVSSVTKTITVS